MRIQGVTEAMSKARASMSDEGFQDAARVLNNTLNVLRETMQRETAVLIADLITKLKHKTALSPTDLEVARLWVIGDAESHAKMQKECDQLLSRFTSLEADLGAYERRDSSATELVDAQGVIEDAMRISYDIAKFLEQKERIANYERAVKDPSHLDHQLLANLLARKLESEKE